jgi:hypothetical protein
MLAAKNFTALANKITPNILRITAILCFPSSLSMCLEDFKTT